MVNNGINTLIVIRNEADHDRALALGRGATGNRKLFFLFIGDKFLYYKYGINNVFLKEVYNLNDFKVLDVSDFNIIGRILKNTYCFMHDKLNAKYSVLTVRALNVLYSIIHKIYRIRKKRIINTIIKSIAPNEVFTDNSTENDKSMLEIFRRECAARDIPVYIFAHGIGGSLMQGLYHDVFCEYKNYKVFASSGYEVSVFPKNRILLGDLANSYTHIRYLNSISSHDLNNISDKKYKIAFIVGGTLPDITNAWCEQEQLIMNLSVNNDVQMILKLHPREPAPVRLRHLAKYRNLLILDNNIDTGKVIKWADIVILNDSTSTLIIPIVIGKKVIVIEGKKSPRFANHYSLALNAHINHFNNVNDIVLDDLIDSQISDDVLNEIAWGGHGRIDLGKKCFTLIDGLLQKEYMHED